MGFGGAERVISIISNAFVDNGHEIKIISINSSDLPVYQLNSKIHFQSLPPLNRKKPVTIPKLFIRLRITVKQYKPDVIISFIKDTCAIAILACLGLHIPIVYSERCDPRNVPNNLSFKFFNTIVKMFSNGFVFQSDAAKKLYPKNAQNKSVIIFNPLNIKKLPPYYNGVRSKKIVTIGRLDRQKNHRLLIDAFFIINSEYSDYKLIIYGEGELRQELQTHINDLGLSDKVILEGNKSNVLEEINEASVFVLSSDFEGLPNSLIEAMAIGLPCITTDWSPGGASTFIESGKNGIIVPMKNKEKLAYGIKEIISCHEKSVKMGNEARKIIEKTNEKEIIDLWEKFLIHVIQRSN